MNQRLQGWKLALALLIPATIIGVAGFTAYNAFSGDETPLATGGDAAETTPTATAVAESTPLGTPAVAAVPTPLVVPTLAAGPTAAPGPSAAPAPTPTRPPSPRPTSTGPAPTAGPAPTVTPNVVTLSCSGVVPATLTTGQTFGPLSAVTNPAAAAATYQFVWSVGTTTAITAPSTGPISYTEAGSYTVKVTGTTASGLTLNATCGTVTVTKPVTPLKVNCTVTSVNSQIALKDARSGDPMQVAVTWTPEAVKLNLQYEFGTNDPIVFSTGASSGDSQQKSFNSNDGVFSIFWRDAGSGATGRVECPAYPGAIVDPNATATPVPSVAPTATPTPTGTPIASPTPTPTNTAAP